MYEKTLSIILTLVAFSFIGSGITGFYSLDFEQPVCIEDDDCSYSVCCPVYDQEWGVCDQEDQCAGIYLASQAAEQVQKTSEDSVLAAAPDLDEQVTQSYVAVALGLIILLIIGVVSYVEWKQHAVAPALRKKKASKKKVKKKVSKKKSRSR
jgi:hypothetical protein